MPHKPALMKVNIEIDPFDLHRLRGVIIRLEPWRPERASTGFGMAALLPAISAVSCASVGGMMRTRNALFGSFYGMTLW
jgi:hypothetical protein